jgi:Protein of unknown function (DUF1376)
MRKSENFYRRDPAKALSGMVGLTLEERGVYNTVLDLLYSTWRPLEDDRAFIAGWCGAAPQKVNPIIRRLIEKGRLIAFEEAGRSYLSDSAFEAERATVKGISETRSGRGKVGEKSEEVGQKSEKDTTSSIENTENQKVVALDKKREEKKESPKPPGGLFDSDFDYFWAAYPKKVAKPSAIKAFAKASKRKPVSDMVAAIERQKTSDRWRRGFVKDPATWLNNDGWDDQLEGMEPSPDGPLEPGTARTPSGLVYRPDAFC